MKFGSISIYYNLDWGYIIASDTTMKDSIMLVTMNPVVVEKIGITEKQLGEAALVGLEKSRRALPVAEEEIKDFKFWQISGIKGFAAFSRKVKCVEVEEKGNILKVQRLKRDSDGSYSWMKNDAGIELPITASDEQIGQAVYDMLHLDEMDSQKEEDTVSFQSVNEKKVIYHCPPDCFIDAGDGHTDAYQIYINENDPNSYIAFLIDNGYSEISDRGIQKRWKQIYGRVKEYRFEEKNEGILKIVVSAKTKQSSIKSYFYQDGEDLLEVLTEISSNIPQDQQLEIEKDMTSIINSISIE